MHNHAVLGSQILMNLHCFIRVGVLFFHESARLVRACCNWRQAKSTIFCWSLTINQKFLRVRVVVKAPGATAEVPMSLLAKHSPVARQRLAAITQAFRWPVLSRRKVEFNVFNVRAIPSIKFCNVFNIKMVKRHFDSLRH